MGGGISDINGTSVRDNSLVEIVGGTDGTAIGNVGDAIKVTGNVIAETSESELATFVASARDVQIGPNKSMFSILNGIGSGVVIKLISLKIINSQTTAITGAIADFRLHRATSISSGNIVISMPHDTQDVVNSLVEVRNSATVNGENITPLTRVKWSTDEWGVGAQDVESMDHAVSSLISWYEVKPKTKPITLRSGEGIHIKQVAANNNGSFDFECIFTQE